MFCSGMCGFDSKKTNSIADIATFPYLIHIIAPGLHILYLVGPTLYLRLLFPQNSSLPLIDFMSLMKCHGNIVAILIPRNPKHFCVLWKSTNPLGSICLICIVIPGNMNWGSVAFLDARISCVANNIWIGYYDANYSGSTTSQILRKRF